MHRVREPRVHLLLVGDSRVYSFDRYRLPADFNLHIDFVIRRGATLSDLIAPTLRQLRNYNSQDWVLVRLAAGINDLIEFTGPGPHRVLVRSPTDANQLILRLQQFREAILRQHQNTVISFITIPTASFCKFQENKQLAVPELTPVQLKVHQHDLDNQLDTVNSFIEQNSQDSQAEIIPRYLHWHSYIRRPTKRRNRTGRITKAITRNRFTLLYDGLHAVSTVKRRWFVELGRAFVQDHMALRSKLNLT